MQRQGIRLILALAVLLIAVGCSRRAGDGAFVVGLEGNPTNLDPRYAVDAYSSRIRPLLFDSLIETARDGTFVGRLAQSWELSEDGLTYTFHLRPGVQFHDGTPLTSRDVVYTFEYIRNPDNKCPTASGLSEIDKIEAPDPLTVRFNLKQTFVPAMFKFVKGIVPAHLGDAPDFSDRLIGTGPYRLADFRRGERIELRANPDYFDGAPSIGKLRFEVVLSDTTRMLRLKKGDLHLVQNALPPYSLKFFQRLDHLQVLRDLGVNYSYLGFNMQDGRGVTDKVQVRRAIAHAIDRRQILDALLYGQARPATGLLAPSNWAYSADVPVYDYDPEKARALLDAAGFPDPDGDGPLSRFTLSFKTSTNKLRNRIAEVIAGQLAQVGISLERRSYEWGTFYDDIKKGNFQTFTLTWVGITDPDIFHYIFHSDNQPPKGANRGRYINPEIDKLIDSTRVETGVEKRRALFGEIQRILAEDCVYISLWWADNIVVADKSLKGFEVLPGGEYTYLSKATWDKGQ